jgi:archaellum biogenesis ATPase FlaH
LSIEVSTSERELLGALLLDPTLAPKMAEILGAHDFQDRTCRWAFKAICARVETGEPIDPRILIDLIPEKNQKKHSRAVEFITSILENAVTSATWGYHARRIREESIKREFHKVLENGADAELLLNLSQALADLQNPQPETKSVIESSDLFAAEFKTPDPVIAGGILPEGGGLILAGESGQGKSLMRLELALHMALALECWGLAIPIQRRIFIVQFENTLAEERFRLGKMLHGLRMDGPQLKDRLAFSDPTIRFDLGIKGDRKKASDLIKRSEADVIVWDPLSSLHSKNENDNVEIRAVLDTITWINRQTGSSSIVIHHFGKPDPDRGIEHRTRGASSIRDWADTLVALMRKPHAHKTQRLLTFVKIRNGPERPAILLERDDHFLHHLVDEEMICPPERVREILVGLGGKVETQGELAAAIAQEAGCSLRSGKNYIKTAVERGLIKSTEGEHTQKRGYIVWA